MGWKAKFVPQMWVNDYAVDVDAYGETTWEIDASAVTEAFDDARRGGDWDYIRDDPNAPFWVREWFGPFYVELISPDGDVLSERDVRCG